MAYILSETADILENNMDIREIPHGLEPALELRQKGIILLEHPRPHQVSIPSNELL